MECALRHDLALKATWCFSFQARGGALSIKVGEILRGAVACRHSAPIIDP